jgi:uncharacterized protein (DUF1684 family)
VRPFITRPWRAGGLLLVAVVGVAGCARDAWPEPPAVDQAKYAQEYEQWRKNQRETAAYALPLVGAWPLAEGDTPFGSDPSLPIALPAKVGVAKAGVFRRTGQTVTVVPEPGAPLRAPDGSAVSKPIRVDDGTTVTIGSIHLSIFGGPPGFFVSGSDDEHPDLENLHIETYPVDPRWRVAARFDAFDTPRRVQIGTTRGGSEEMTASGELVFRLAGQESRLTALSEPGNDQFFVMFKDATNGKTTYSGYRILSPPIVKGGGWTVLDFNLASNPPCAYSRYTMCPLPPKENRLTIAVEAGVKRHPTAQGYSE